MAVTQWSLCALILLIGYLPLAVGSKAQIQQAFAKGKQAWKELYEEIKPNFHQFDTLGSKHNCRIMLDLVRNPSTRALHLEGLAVMYLAATRDLVQTTGLTVSQLRAQPGFLADWRKENKVRGFQEEGGCSGPIRSVKNYCKKRNRYRNLRYRTADGLCNNFRNPTWGRSHSPHVRFIPPQYGDVGKLEIKDTTDSPSSASYLYLNQSYDNNGHLSTKIYDKRDDFDFSIVKFPFLSDLGDVPRIHSVVGTNTLLPNARHLSNAVLRDPTEVLDQKHTHMLMAWGQFFDHDVTLTPGSKGMGGASINCCARDTSGNLITRAECFPVPLDSNDPYVPFQTKTCYNFVRSAPAIEDGCGLSHRETLNQVTHFADASHIYGSTDSETSALKTRSGFMKSYGANMLPKANPDDCKVPNDLYHCLRAGDARVNEFPTLSLLHIIFMREHNRLAAKLRRTCRRLRRRRNGETLFQETRRIIIGITQKITFEEFLPKILGSLTMRRHNLEPDQYRKYLGNVNPSIMNDFATAAFRYGHSQIGNFVRFMNGSFTMYDTKPIVDIFHTPTDVQHEDRLADIGRWLISTNTNTVDNKFVEGMQDRLFEDPSGESFDISVNNIQRGRDHGLPPYMEYRRACGLSTVSSFAALPDHGVDDRNSLASIYANVEDIDLYIGGITEKHVEGGVVGPTFACLIAEQFYRLKFGDSHYYERPMFRRSYSQFTNVQIKEIKKHSLAKVMCENLGLNNANLDVFKMPECLGNPAVDCSALQELDVSRFC